MPRKAEKVIPCGSFVYSKCGHDKGGLFLTISESDGGYVLLADGMTRKLQKPKRKKVIHIELTTLQRFDIADLTNKKIAAAVKEKMNETCSFECRKGDN